MYGCSIFKIVSRNTAPLLYKPIGLCIVSASQLPGHERYTFHGASFAIRTRRRQSFARRTTDRFRVNGSHDDFARCRAIISHGSSVNQRIALLAQFAMNYFCRRSTDCPRCRRDNNIVTPSTKRWTESFRCATADPALRGNRFPNRLQFQNDQTFLK